MATSYMLVTGAAGFIAHHWIRRLLEERRPVIGVDNFDSFYAEDVKRRNVADLEAFAREKRTPFVFQRLDVTHLDPRHFSDKRIEEITHLAAKAGVRPSLEAPADYVVHNVLGTVKVLEFMRERGVRNLLFGSSSSVYGDDTPAPFREEALKFHPVSPYAATKQSAELLVGTYATLFDIRAALLRFFTVYGPRQRPDLAIHGFTRRLFAGHEIPLFGAKDSVRDYTYVGDVIRGLAAARRWLERAPSRTAEAFNIASGRPVGLEDLVTALERATGRKAKIKILPPQPGDVRGTFGSVEKSGAVLGYRPETSLEEGLARFVEWFRESPPKSPPPLATAA